jgi:hypothetical protein
MEGIAHTLAPLHDSMYMAAVLKWSFSVNVSLDLISASSIQHGSTRIFMSRYGGTYPRDLV